ncbi:MAG: NTP pyrophosphatase (non-canonical NTP hydrolase), partial [Gammaproteobacteria bacterium]
MDLTAIQQRLAQFAAVRDWEQFHSPKNLAAALAVEAAELLEIFQWMTEEESRQLRSGDAALQ